MNAERLQKSHFFWKILYWLLVVFGCIGGFIVGLAFLMGDASVATKDSFLSVSTVLFLLSPVYGYFSWQMHDDSKLHSRIESSGRFFIGLLPIGLFLGAMAFGV